MKVGILTISDKGSQGLRTDTSGPALSRYLSEREMEIAHYKIVPDEEDVIAATLIEWADKSDLDFILTTGGTGLSPRDVTPEATLRIVERLIPGIGELMRIRSLEKTPMAALSRAVAGVRSKTLIINLPGSPRGAVENLEAVWTVIFHAVAKIQGDQTDCAMVHHSENSHAKEIH